MLAFLAAGMVAIGGGSPAWAWQEASKPAEASAEGKGEKKDKGKEEPKPVITKHTAVIDGKEIAFTATAGMLPQLDDQLKVKANVFYVAYTKDGAAAESRPILFSFNGGPGSSSVWLHMGTLGPTRVAMGVEGEMLPAPGKLEANPHSWLDLADLVFIDPVTTGFSRAAEGESDKQFHGLDEDIRSVANFIRLYITRHNRWMSPKFVIGESYGGTRAAGLAGALQDSMGISLNGVILVSPAVDFATLRFDDNNDLPYVLFLPTYAATAWYHGRLSAELQALPLTEVVERAEQFATTEYLMGLVRGARLVGEPRRTLAEKIASFTGLSVEYVLAADLRPVISNFTKELLRDRGLTVGRFDSRYTGLDRVGVSATPDYDPSYAVIQGAYTAGFNAYVRGVLQYESDLPYEILTGRVQPWTFPQGRYATTSESLRSAMTKNPGLRVLFTGGYYDLATPYFATQYTADHLGLHESLRGHVSTAWYEGGHMYYLREADLKKFKADGAKFFGEAMMPAAPTPAQSPRRAGER